MKNNKWLIAQSFERAHEVVSAINTLRIHAKLTLAGVDDSGRHNRVVQARKYLLAFLDQFETIIENVDRNKEGTVLGADPRLGQLAKKFLTAKHQWPRPSTLYSSSFKELRNLLTSTRAEDLERLITFLRDLRSLIEQHAHADIIGILGEI